VALLLIYSFKYSGLLLSCLVINLYAWLNMLFPSVNFPRHDTDIEFDLDRVKVNHRAKYLGQRSFRLKVIVRTHTQTQTHTHTHTHTADRQHYTTTSRR